VPLNSAVAANSYAGEVSAGATVAEAAPLFGNAGTRLLVKSAAGEPIGALDRDTVVAVMMRG
jgi:glycine betaine/proline transport system ATP-binding protein